VSDSPYHEGELAVQQRAGVREMAARVGRMFRDHMPDQHRELFEKLPYLVIGTVDDTRQPWAAILVGPPGFVASPDEHSLAIDAVVTGPAAPHLQPGAPIGILGIELHTRRRNRVNGTIAAVGAAAGGAMHVLVDQSFGNCPQYIQARAPVDVVTGAPGDAHAEGARLSAAAVALVRSADTFFIATAAPAIAGDPRRGVDVSHRGGRAGFVRVTDDGDASVLTFPDSHGNQAFNTLGNLALEPRAGLLFIDWATGDTLQLTGEATIVWSGPELAGFAGAERLVRMRITGGVRRERGVPLRWTPGVEAKQIAATGSW
jgi:uncharacterized protein